MTWSRNTEKNQFVTTISLGHKQPKLNCFVFPELTMRIQQKN